MTQGLYAIIPVKSLSKTKTRLSALLSPEERRQLNLIMLEDILKTVTQSATTEGTIVVSPDQSVLRLARRHDAITLPEPRDEGVNAAVAKGVRYSVDRGAQGSLVIPSDLPCLTPLELRQIDDLTQRGPQVTLTPSLRLDGTNLLLRRPPRVIPTHYDQDSFTAHIHECSKKGVKLNLYLADTVMLDLDTLADIALFLERPKGSQVHRFLSSIVERRDIHLTHPPQDRLPSSTRISLSVQEIESNPPRTHTPGRRRPPPKTS